tara:strand:+ start:130 stop:858 length:729 start_codon:yes stop_codon:yes gene_type:complete
MKKRFFRKKLIKLVRWLAKKLNKFDLFPPFEYVQMLSEESVHSFLNVEKSAIKHWVIVGGCYGYEIPKILENYPNCIVSVFECSKRYARDLQEKFLNNKRVNIITKAVSDEVGQQIFFETNRTGSGSLLKVGELAKRDYDMEQAEDFSVETTTLDKFFIDEKIDVLQIDVQGAELMVLEGAVETLPNIRAVFVEVSVHPNLYQNSVVFDDLHNFFNKFGFHLCLFGTGYNLTGNALYVRQNL